MQYNKKSSRVDYLPDRGFPYNSRPHKVLCVVCGDEFKSGKTADTSRYCSGRCANDFYIATRRERMNKKRAAANKCVICEEPIQQNGAKIIKYCSNACKQKAYRQRTTKI